MTSLFVGLYGLFFLLVGINGNSRALLSAMSEDMPDYLPWLVAIIAIAILSEFEATEKLVKPFAVLLMLNFFLRNFGTIETEAKKIWNLSEN